MPCVGHHTEMRGAVLLGLPLVSLAQTLLTPLPVPKVCLNQVVDPNLKLSYSFEEESHVYSSNGELAVTLNYFTWVDQNGNTAYCK